MLYTEQVGGQGTSDCQSQHPEIHLEDVLLRECLGQQKLNEDIEEEEEPLWKEKSLPGMYYQQIEGMADIDKSTGT